jgi:hypothetical protein
VVIAWWLVMAYVFLEHPSSLEHDTGTYYVGGSIILYPEHARRITVIERELSAQGWDSRERRARRVKGASRLVCARP